MPFTALYDANVLYPNTLRDLLIRIAQSGRVQARWTKPTKPWTSTEKGVRASQFSACRNAARIYGLTQSQPSDIIDRQVTTVREIGPRTPKSLSIP